MINMQCLIGRHDLGDPEIIGGYDLGMIDRKEHDYDRGSIYVRVCSRCSLPFVEYHPEIDYLALSRTKEPLSPLY